MANLIDFPIGFGTFLMNGDECIESVVNAIKCGYRHIDTAQSYENEAEVGCAIEICISEGIVSRNDIFLVSKINPHKPIGYQEAIDAVQSSLKKLRTDYIDLYLIHYPNNAPSAKWKKLNADTWRGLEYCVDKGWIKSLGVSNFNIHHLEELFNTAKIKPLVNQLHLSPIWQQKELVNYCKLHNIQCVAWSPLVRFIDRVPFILEEQVWESEDWTKPLMSKLENKYNKSAAQICIRWSIQSGFIPLVKSTKISRMMENQSIFDFSISYEDMEQLNSLNARPIYPEAEFDAICTTWAYAQKTTEIKYISKRIIKLFNLILLKINRISKDYSKLYLLGFLPIINIINDNKRKIFYKFCGIPILTKRIKSQNREKYYLFNYIPVLTHTKQIIKEGYAVNLVPDYRHKIKVYSKYNDLNLRLFKKLFELPKFQQGILSLYMRFYMKFRLLVTRKVPLSSLDVHLTTSCNMSCRDCSQCIPYYSKDEFQSMSYMDFKNELEIILKHVDKIYFLYISGGEPFLNHDLCSILAFLETKKNVQNVIIRTNGTIYPNDEFFILCKKSKKISLSITNFDKNKSINISNCNKLIYRLKTDKINYMYNNHNGWWKKQPEINFDQNSSIEEIQDIFYNCELKYNTLWANGKIYPCAYAKYINSKLNNKYNTDFIDLHSTDLSSKNFREFFNVSMYRTCRSCNLEHYGEIILPGVQFKKVN